MLSINSGFPFWNSCICPTVLSGAVETLSPFPNHTRINSIHLKFIRLSTILDRVLLYPLPIHMWHKYSGFSPFLLRIKWIDFRLYIARHRACTDHWSQVCLTVSAAALENLSRARASYMCRCEQRKSADNENFRF